MKEPIEYFTLENGFDRNHIAEWVIGEKYTGIMNTDGYVGVCATLGTAMDDGLFWHGEADTRNPCHRIILNAYFNSIFNYHRKYNDIKDIFDRIDFSKHKKIVMVGYFETLYKKFSSAGIPLEVFDIHKESEVISDINKMKSRLSEAETIILTGTTIFNNTFRDICSCTPDDSNIFLLGPSNILSDEMFKYRNVKVVFGSVFEKNDFKVLEKISDGCGTKGFLPYLQKVYIINNNYRDEI